MTATNMCSNFGGFRCSPPLTLHTTLVRTILVHSLLFDYWKTTNAAMQLRTILVCTILVRTILVYSLLFDYRKTPNVAMH